MALVPGEGVKMDSETLIWILAAVVVVSFLTLIVTCIRLTWKYDHYKDEAQFEIRRLEERLNMIQGAMAGVYMTPTHGSKIKEVVQGYVREESRINPALRYLWPVFGIPVDEERRD